jgi:hypothetical protein
MIFFYLTKMDSCHFSVTQLLIKNIEEEKKIMDFFLCKNIFFFMQNIFSMIILLKNIFFLKIYMTIKQIITVQNKIDNFIQKNILIFLM